MSEIVVESELFKKEQMISIVPQDFRNANKGKVIEISDNEVVVELVHPTKGLVVNNLTEFYSQTQNGVLYFESDMLKIDGNLVTIASPIRHRFLQRRKFTRINFIQETDFLLQNKSHHITTMDLSAGGMKLKTTENVDIEFEYDVCIQLSENQSIKCKFQPIRIEKKDAGFYIISGRFKDLSRIDKMILVQYCMKKKIENVNQQRV